MFQYYISYLVPISFLNVSINDLRGINKRKLGLDKFYAKLHSSIDLARVSLTRQRQQISKKLQLCVDLLLSLESQSFYFKKSCIEQIKLCFMGALRRNMQMNFICKTMKKILFPFIGRRS